MWVFRQSSVAKKRYFQLDWQYRFPSITARTYAPCVKRWAIRHDCAKLRLMQTPSRLDALFDNLSEHTWLVTGGAGFIGSHIIAALLSHGQRVTCLDDLSTGRRENLDAVAQQVGEQNWSRCTFIEADIAEDGVAMEAVRGADFVSHQAALGSVPRSIEEPLETHRINVHGFALLCEAAMVHNVKRIVFASSSAVYGDGVQVPIQEADVGNPCSPYGASKIINELWARGCAYAHDGVYVGLRYFNVFGTRQRPDGPYAAVIPSWLHRMVDGKAPIIFGDGMQTRDFTPVELAVHANLLAALEPTLSSGFHPFNVAPGVQLSLLELESMMREVLGELVPDLEIEAPIFEAPRPGDIRHSHADVTRFRVLCTSEVQFRLRDALVELCKETIRQPSP